MSYLSAPGNQPGALTPLKGDMMAKAIGYIVLHAGSYSDTRSSFIPCKTRDAVENRVQLGWNDEPGVWIYTVTRGQTADAVIDALVESRDPYPDYVVKRGPRGGYVWQRA